MNTLTQNRITFSTASRPIGADTENVTFNIPRRAFKILNDVAKPNRSALIRTWIADGIQKRDTWSGLAFRAAIGLRNFAQSIFTPSLTPQERQRAFEASLEAAKEAKNDLPTGGARLIGSLVELKDDGTFEPQKYGRGEK